MATYSAKKRKKPWDYLEEAQEIGKASSKVALGIGKSPEKKQAERTPAIPSLTAATPENIPPPTTPPKLPTPKIIVHPDRTITEITYDINGVTHYSDYTPKQWNTRLGLLGADYGGVITPMMQEQVGQEQLSAALERIHAGKGSTQDAKLVKSAMEQGNLEILPQRLEQLNKFIQQAEAANPPEALPSGGDRPLAHAMTLGTAAFSKTGAIAGGGAAAGATVLGAPLVPAAAIGLGAALAGGEIAFEYNYRKSDKETAKGALTAFKTNARLLANSANNPNLIPEDKANIIEGYLQVRNNLYAAESLLQQKSFIEKVGYSHEEMIKLKEDIAIWKWNDENIYWPKIRRALLTPDVTSYNPNFNPNEGEITEGEVVQ